MPREKLFILSGQKPRFINQPPDVNFLSKTSNAWVKIPLEGGSFQTEHYAAFGPHGKKPTFLDFITTYVDQRNRYLTEYRAAYDPKTRGKRYQFDVEADQASTLDLWASRRNAAKPVAKAGKSTREDMHISEPMHKGEDTKSQIIFGDEKAYVPEPFKKLKHAGWDTHSNICFGDGETEFMQKTPTVAHTLNRSFDGYDANANIVTSGIGDALLANARAGTDARPAGAYRRRVPSGRTGAPSRAYRSSNQHFETTSRVFPMI
ncbi:hypothetical protein CYMTET_23987 [Cymbomonas tetramitiformis]|uniref:Uncharacterized protein n=1 Tax=Cymbomonas tetramitiformis TaxID=36881 RepID=A0AAE0FWP0_9CHLO|nr:hypothetical protein CYMTET_23987 [Cymbomonas tetramitiformis]